MTTVPEVFVFERMLSDFAWHADRGEGDSLAALFLPDGRLTVGGKELEGRLEIAKDSRSRHSDPATKTRHVWSNLRIVQMDADLVRTTAVQLTFEQKGPDKPTQLRVNDLFDEFAKDAEGAWRFASRVISREMALAI